LNVIVYEGATLSEGAELCLDARLYVSGWDLRPTLVKMRDRGMTHGGKIAVAFEHDRPIALCLFSGRMLMAFCRDDHRRRGFGSACAKAIGRPEGSWAGEGVHGSIQFWKANGVYALPRQRARLKAA
jgi:hypothetical protein